MTAEFRSHMAKVPTSVVVAAALDGDAPIGMVVGTFTSVSLVPPMVGFLGDLGSTTLPRLIGSGRISFSVLASEAFPAVTDAFRRPPHERFEGLDEDLETRKLIAATVAAEQVERLQAIGFENFHFYTLNQADLTYAICRILGIKPGPKPLEAAA